MEGTCVEDTPGPGLRWNTERVLPDSKWSSDPRQELESRKATTFFIDSPNHRTYDLNLASIGLPVGAFHHVYETALRSFASPYC